MRKQNTLAFRQVFRHFVAILKGWRLIEGKTIAIDSFKVTAQNSLKNNYNLAKIHRHLDYIDAKIDAYCEELDQADDDDEKEQLHAKIIDQIDKWNLNLQSQENCACQTTGWSILGFPVLLKRLKDAFLSIFDYILVP